MYNDKGVIIRMVLIILAVIALFASCMLDTSNTSGRSSGSSNYSSHSGVECPYCHCSYRSDTKQAEFIHSNGHCPDCKAWKHAQKN